MSHKPSPSGLHKNGAPVTDWPTIRRWVLERDNYLCQTCKESVATEVDHTWPRRLGGTDHIDNLRAICGPCNKLKGARVDIFEATDQQLRLAAVALTARIRALEIEYNEVISESMKRHVISGNEHLARSLLSGLEVRVADREMAAAGWRSVVEKSFKPKTIEEMLDDLSPLLDYIGHLTHMQQAPSQFSAEGTARMIAGLERISAVLVGLTKAHATAGLLDEGGQP